MLCDYDSSSSSDPDFDEGIQVNDLEYSSSSSDDHELYVLTKEEEEILLRLDNASENEKLQMLKDINNNTLSLTKSDLPYNLKKILNRGKKDKKKEIIVNDL